MRVWIIAIFALSIGLGCGGTTPSEGPSGPKNGKADDPSQQAPLVITKTMNGKVVEAQVGEVLEIRLDGNPTTGYEWQIVASSTSLPISSDEFIPDDTTVEGSGGTYVFTVQPDTFAAGGTHLLKFAYFRPWEGVAKAIETFSVSIKVVKPSASITVDQSMNGQTVTAAVGDTVEIRLQGNPTTGYEWQTVASSTSLPISSREFIADDPTVEGSGGTYVFTVQPDTFAAGGTHLLQFAYFRPWEGVAKAIETFSVSIQIL